MAELTVTMYQEIFAGNQMMIVASRGLPKSAHVELFPGLLSGQSTVKDALDYIEWNLGMPVPSDRLTAIKHDDVSLRRVKNLWDNAKNISQNMPTAGRDLQAVRFNRYNQSLRGFYNFLKAQVNKHEKP